MAAVTPLTCCAPCTAYATRWAGDIFYVLARAERRGPQVIVTFDRTTDRPAPDHQALVRSQLAALSRDVLVHRESSIAVVETPCWRLPHLVSKHPGAMTVTLDCSPAAPDGYVQIPWGWWERPPTWAQQEAAKRGQRLRPKGTP